MKKIKNKIQKILILLYQKLYIQIFKIKKKNIKLKINREVVNNKYLQSFITEVGWFWWIKLVQLAVKDIETIKAHLRLNYYRIPHMNTIL